MNKVKQSYFILAIVALILFVTSYQITIRLGDVINRAIFTQQMY